MAPLTSKATAGVEVPTPTLLPLSKMEEGAMLLELVHLARKFALPPMSAPTGPCGPTGPAGPCAPIGPAGPCGPLGPSGPCAPIGPTAPAGPAGPLGPTRPLDGPTHAPVASMTV